MSGATAEGRQYLADHGVFDGLIWRWASNGTVPPADCLVAGGVSQEVLDRCAKVRTSETQAFLARYRQERANHIPTPEEEYEIRAAFGADAVKVVDIITGKPILRRAK